MARMLTSHLLDPGLHHPATSSSSQASQSWTTSSETLLALSPMFICHHVNPFLLNYLNLLVISAILFYQLQFFHFNNPLSSYSSP